MYRNLMTITPEQGNSKWYRKALKEEIEASSNMTEEELAAIPINHPEILRYKGKIIASSTFIEGYADWTKFLLTEFGSKEKCLSLGSGLGRIEKYLINIGFTEFFDSIDLIYNTYNTVQLEKSKILAQAGDLNFFQLEYNSYDFILCHGILHHLINLENALYQINRALKPEGLLLVYEYVGENRWQFNNERLEILRSILPEFNFHRPKFWPEGFESIRSSDILPLLAKQFGNHCIRSVSYGGVYFPFLISNGPGEFSHMQRIVKIDEEVMNNGILAPCYHMGIYKKSNLDPVQVIPWTDDQLRKNLVPPNVNLMKKFKEIKKIINKYI